MKATFITIQKVRTSSQGAYYKNIRWWPGWWDQNDGFGKFSLVDLFESEVKGLVKWQSCLWDDQLSGHCALTVVTVTVMLLRDNWPKCVDRVDYWIIRCWTVWSRQEKKRVPHNACSTPYYTQKLPPPSPPFFKTFHPHRKQLTHTDCLLYHNQRLQFFQISILVAALSSHFYLKNVNAFIYYHRISGFYTLKRFLVIFWMFKKAEKNLSSVFCF